MPHARPITVGPYGFSLHDARRTLAHSIDLLGAFPASTHAAQTHRLEHIAHAVEGVDIMRLGIEEAQHALDQVWPLLMTARDDRILVENLPATTTGGVVQLNRSGGGVPKLAVDAIDVHFGGVVGDVQATRQHHGKPNQALCLWNIETIDSLRADGHPIGPGSTGENVTLRGFPWPDLTPGVRLQIGSVLCEVSSFTGPCAQNARWFSDRMFSRIHHLNGTLSRIYATVLEPGRIVTGDSVVLEPQP